MKIRSDFVTNSSSSSFICDICDHTESGWDIGLSDVDMYECENGHTFCQCHIKELSREEMIELILSYEMTFYNRNSKKYESVSREYFNDKDDDEVFDFLTEDGSNLPAAMCPICSLEEAKTDDLLNYLLKKNNLNTEEILKEWKETFNSYTELRDYLRN